MINILKKSVGILLCAVISIQAPFDIVSANDNSAVKETASDICHQTAVTFFERLSMTPDFEKEVYSLVTRAEFASWICDIYGVSDGNAAIDSVVAGDKYTGFTNEPEFDSNGDWIWNTETNGQEDKYDENSTFISTPYYDVTTTHSRINDIFFVSKLGIMNGSDGYFRPDEPITGYEVVKILVELCGGKLFANENYPSGYYKQAKKMDILDNVKSIGDYGITYRDLLMALYNALHAKVYEITSINGNGIVTLTDESDRELLEYLRGIKHSKGVLNANSVTSLTSNTAGSEGRISVDEREYLTEKDEYDDYLGQLVDIYYTDDDNTIAVIPNYRNEELIVDADDINEYTNTYLEYFVNNKKRKQYIGSKTNIVYNGKALTDYSDDMIDIDYGYIRFLDAEGDGTYETVFIWDESIFWVSGVDVYNEVIQNKLTFETLKTLELENATYKIYDLHGKELALYDISPDNVLSVYKSDVKQGETVVKIICSVDIVEGKVSSVSSDENAISVDDIEYETVLGFDASKVVPGKNARFYLSPTSKIIACRIGAGDDMYLGYIIALGCKSGIRKDYKLKMYSVDEDKVKIYEIADKIKLNDGKKTDAENVFSAEIMKETNDNGVKQQLIRFHMSEDGKIDRIVTADGCANEFVTLNLPAVASNGTLEFKWRKLPNVFFANDSTAAAVYCNTSTKIIHIPSVDKDNENLYYQISTNQDSKYKITMALNDDKGSSVADIVVVMDNEQTTFKNEDPIYMVSEISKCIDENGDDAYKIEYVGNKSGDIVVSDDNLFDIIKDFSNGDLFRYTLANKRVVWLEKIFDCGTKQNVIGKNPYGNESNRFASAVHYVHGRVAKKTDDGAFVFVDPYEYTITDDVLSVTDEDSENQFVIKASDYYCWEYNSSRNLVSNANYMTDLFDSESFGIDGASEVVVYSCFGDPKTIYIYK